MSRVDYVPDESVEQHPSKFIVAMIIPETGPYGSCARVIASNHPRFVEGYRFDYGFLGIALDEGYTVVYIGNQVPSLAARRDTPEREKEMVDWLLSRHPLHRVEAEGIVSRILNWEGKKK